MIRFINILLGVGMVLLGASSGMCAQLSTSTVGNQFVLRWEGDENITVSLPAQGGLLNQPVAFTVDDKSLAFSGFAASMNGKSREGWETLSEQSRLDGNRVVITQKLKHPELESPTDARFEVWMTPENKAVHFQISLEGKDQHLDYLGVGPHSGEGLACKRLYFGSCVINGPIKPFDTRRLGNRYWTLELENGLTEMQGMDLVPMGYTFSSGDSSAVYDMHTYCSSPVTYTLVVT